MLNILYCALAVVEGRLPGWHMFESVERLEPTLKDRDGRTLDLADYLPRDARLVDYGELTLVVRFVCEKERARAPFVFEEKVRGVRAELGPDDCSVHASR